MKFILPPITKNNYQQIRHAGFEIEYSGIDIKKCANIIIKLYGGKVTKESLYKTEIENTKFGKFSIYIDSKYLKELENFPLEEYLNKEISDVLLDSVLSISEIIVPYEIVTPPIPFDKLDNLCLLRESLKQNGALGTNASILFAFGLHINIETPSFEIKDILDIFRSFLIFYEWIKEKENINLTRKLTWFIDPFEKEYIQKVININYKPTLKEFTNDYIKYNPTRNRALDLLPLLSFLNKEVKEKLPNEKINPRPAFHYRLPNSRIDEKEWSIAKEFNMWSLIEKIAYDKENLYNLCNKYNDFLNSSLWFIPHLWIKEIEKFMENYEQ